MRISFLLISTIISCAHLQSQDDIPLAKVGQITITQKEFVSRYELTPGINRRISNLEANKNEFLLSLIAEKLLIVRARQSGWDGDSAYNNVVKDVERLLVRDELYRREVSQKIVITDAERKIALQRSLNDVKTYFLYARTQTGADSLSVQIQQGKPLETFSFRSDTTSGFEGPDSAIARWGDVDERMDEVLYTLKLGQTSKPVHLDDGWYIVKLMGKTTTFLEGAKERNAARERVEQILRKRKEFARMTEFMNTELKSTTTEINARLFKSIVASLWNLAQQRNPYGPDTVLFFVDHAAVESVKVLMHDAVNHPFVTFPHTQWTAGTTLEKVSQTNLATARPSLRSISIDLQQRIRDLIDQEYIAEIGYKKGLHQSAAVRNDMKVWRDAYLAQIVRNKIGDSISVSPREIEELRSVFRDDTSIVHNDDAAYAKMKELKTQESLDRFVGSTANGVEITVYPENVKNVQVTATPSMVFRILGFGGRMFAVPFVIPQLGWMKYWNNRNVVLP